MHVATRLVVPEDPAGSLALRPSSVEPISSSSRPSWSGTSRAPVPTS